jgi:hypothetical protein
VPRQVSDLSAAVVCRSRDAPPASARLVQVIQRGQGRGAGVRPDDVFNGAFLFRVEDPARLVVRRELLGIAQALHAHNAAVVEIGQIVEPLPEDFRL